jgi:serine/threonine protein kinase
MQSGQQIRDYVLGQKIGHGGMGEVWSATHQVLHRQVAIKAMAAHLAADPQFEQRFLDEARAQAILQHSRILGVTDFFREGGVYYLIMPLVAGRSLDERLTEARGPLPVGEATGIASDILDALDYAHQRGIIHRDVKPSNILLDRDGRAYLTDFGIALLVGQDRRTRTGTSLGTPHYMSPEQIRTPRKIDHRADVYSASCVIYEMLAGRPPFLAEDGEGDTDYVLKEAHLQREPEPIRHWNPGISPWLDAVVLRGLAKDPDQRYSGCGELRRALDAAAAGLEPPPLPPPVTRPVPPPIPPPLPTAARVPLPPPVPQAAARSRSGLLLGIGLGAVLALALLIVLGIALSNNTTDSGDTAEEPEIETATTLPVELPKMPAVETLAPTEPAEPALAARIVRVWMEHNVQREGRPGLLIHTHFIIAGARQDNCSLAAYFHYSTGEVLKDFDQDYRSGTGQVSVGEDFVPLYDSTELEDLTLFMPYEELHMAPGKYDLKFDVYVYHAPSEKFLAETEYQEFTFTQP